MELIQLGHGGGGRMMHRLIREYFAPAFELRSLSDSAIVEEMPPGKIAVTTDSYVVSPLFFPGGDIGHLSVCGTVNDLAVSGARPVCLTAGFIIEEGFSAEVLRTVLESMRSVSLAAGVKIIAGDTKVVERGKCDGIFINTAGVGVIPEGVEIAPQCIRSGDKVIITGSIANHGIAVMAGRNGISFDPPVLSDVRPLNSLVEVMLSVTRKIHFMRDPTRGGLATTLKEIAEESGLGISVTEESIKVVPGVRGACELLGLDPLFIANEGVLVAVVDREDSGQLLEAIKETAEGVDAAVIGEVVDKPEKGVVLKTIAGGIRILDMFAGDQLPRIC